MYTCIVGRYTDYFLNKRSIKENSSKIAEILKCHEFVLKKLLLESKTCDTNSQFHMTNIGLDYTLNFNFDYILSFILKNKDDIEKLIDNNNDNGKLVYGNPIVFSRIYLYLKRFGRSTTNAIKLINSFNLRIQWGDITVKLKDVYNNANKLDWPTTNLRSCLLFYSTIFDFFKVIMLRLTWKQFLFIKNQDASLIETLMNQWLMSLKNFVKFLALESDTVTKAVIESISKHIENYPLKNDGNIDFIKLPIYQKKYTEKFVNYISNIISVLCEGLGCKIVENWNTEEVLQTSNRTNIFLDCDISRSNEVYNEITGIMTGP
ncbi:uncharacterized protein LOC126901729 [Daktulosphaira vitifoliae]|uniref:uncharacterized protein LOC126901729 n=1 Tax=Daktulosphaira vitifoliae TaxID=58002 RepID=UPI0021AA624A|nr:uncharacterized protein LOC126901729 [Daktulosphaira vitifoliae]